MNTRDMLLRWIVSNLLRQAAEGHVREMLVPAANELKQRALNGPDSYDDVAEPVVPDTCDVVIVVALGIEANGVLDRLDERVLLQNKGGRTTFGRMKNATVVIVESGEGQTAATAAAIRMIERFRPKWVISAGFAGGLVSELRRGHILIAEVVEDLSENSLEVELNFDKASLSEARTVHVGKLLTVDHLVHDREEKQRLGEKHEALACDMETFAVAKACQELQTPFISVRVISDTVNDQLPREVESLLNQKTIAAKLGTATAALWGRPSTVKDLWKLHETATRASDTLARFLSQTIEQLTSER